MRNYMSLIVLVLLHSSILSIWQYLGCNKVFINGLSLQENSTLRPPFYGTREHAFAQPSLLETFSSFFQGIESDVDDRQRQLGRVEDLAENLLGFLEADAEPRDNVAKTLESVQDR